MNKSERKRMLCVSLAAGAILLCGVLLVPLMRYQHTSAVRPKDRYTGQIPDFYSTVDADGDGVDDQTDVLDNALAYVDTRPKYKSRYYQTGYPDDGYGVCTDVVAFALKNAGYDLQALVDADIREHPHRDGVPYVIHHNSPWQSAYEQDILEKRTDIVGHYRISE